MLRDENQDCRKMLENRTLMAVEHDGFAPDLINQAADFD
jgi:hypothetical protein